MKPSDWILDKIRTKLDKDSASEIELIGAIMAYLDEDWEKSKSKVPDLASELLKDL